MEHIQVEYNLNSSLLKSFTGFKHTSILILTYIDYSLLKT